ncbi:MAG: NtaA/DmoA family FMN-dependent monooxygenase [Azoarcus sp.]|jgi:alkanesulfonate monooxygenase|nr:NtaA/DmoA family FMN-dependent monooxygenase [Azoarcus sp.]
MSTRKLRLGAFLPGAGQHFAAWRHPNARADGILDIEYYKSLARTAERGLFDAFFLADGLAANFGGHVGTGSSSDKAAVFEPVTLFSALSQVTKNLGFIATASTTYEDPFLLARKYASLDYLSHGRAGWNVVTTVGDATARNFGLDKQLSPEERYARAHEFVATVKALWDSWEDDAFVRDKASGQYFDPRKVHAPHHEGKYFKVAGPLNIARPPQGHPVIVQAGQSGLGRELAAETAEVVFTAWQTLADAQAFYRDLKGRLAKYGRSPDSLRIMPGVSPYVGHTEAEARAKQRALHDLIPPEAGLALLGGLLGVEDLDLSRYKLDGPLPGDLPPTQGMTSRQDLILDIARKNNFTIRQLYEWVASGRGHWTIAGTPAQIADQLQEWFENGAADGFNVLPPLLPDGLNDFVDLVIPELQRRGLFRTAYEGSTLRENLGLARPRNQFKKPEPPQFVPREAELAGELLPAGGPTLSSARESDGGDHIYQRIVLVGSSTVSQQDAIEKAVARASSAYPGRLRWFEVIDSRGHIDADKVAHWQVALKIGITLQN